MCVCVCICSNLPPHTLESQKRDTNGFIAIQEPFKILPILLKMLSSKVQSMDDNCGEWVECMGVASGCGE